MIIEGESDMSQKERDGKKRKVETTEVSQRPMNFQNRFNRRPDFRQNRNMGFQKPEQGFASQSSRPQQGNRQGQFRPPIPDCRICGKKH